MSAAARLLDKLDRPKQTRPGNWIAGCPRCESRRGRPISVRELDDGRVLLHGFCGCTVSGILGALGLQLSDLFPERIGGHFAPPTRSNIPARDLLAVASEDADLVGVIAADMLARREISEGDWKSLANAVARLGELRNHVEA